MPPWRACLHGETIFGSDFTLSNILIFGSGSWSRGLVLVVVVAFFLSLFSLSAWVKLTILVRAAAKSFVNKFYGRKG